MTDTWSTEALTAEPRSPFAASGTPAPRAPAYEDVPPVTYEQGTSAPLTSGAGELGAEAMVAGLDVELELGHELMEPPGDDPLSQASFESPERVSVRDAIAAGVCDVNELTNRLFFARHPERGGRALSPSEPAFATLSTEWKVIRDTVVRPVYDAVCGGSGPPPPATDLWVPGAERVANARSAGGSYVGGPWRFVFHTIEANATPSGFRSLAARHGNPPHLWAMPSADLLLQTVPLNRSAYALARPGATQTNRRQAIQVEVDGYARDMARASQSTLEWLADRLLAPVARMVPIDLDNVRPPGTEGCYGRSSPCRMTPDEWNRFDGVCGHKDVPDNSHWDPGGLDMAAIAARAKARLGGVSVRREAAAASAWATEIDSEHGAVEHAELEAFLDREASAGGTGCVFPSGARLRVVAGPSGPGQEHHDPNGSGEPLYDTSGAVRATKLATNFTVDELAASGSREFDRARISCGLVACLQRIRDHVGRAVSVTSGYRSHQYNVDLYRARGQQPTSSQHSSGRAADIKVSGMSGLELAKLALELCGTDLGLGVARTYAHVDVRGTWARWTYIDDAGERARVIAELDAHRARVRASGGVAPAPGSGPTPAPSGGTTPVTGGAATPCPCR